LYDTVSDTTTTRKQIPRPKTLKASPETLSWAKQSSPSPKASQSTPSGERQQSRNNSRMNSSSSADGLAPKMENVTLRSSYTPHDGLIENFTQSQVQPSAADSRLFSKTPIGSPNKQLGSSFGGVENESAHRGDGTPFSESTARQRFSFLPGDDNGILPTDLTKKYTTKAIQGSMDYNDQRTSESGTSTTTESCQIGQTRPSHRPKQAFKSERNLGPNKPKTPGKGNQPTRKDSQSSIITIVRDNSGRSSKAQDFCNKDVLEPKISRRNGSNEARIAAVRALSGTEEHR
jgi:hypothetical protein